jgi:hypothetical protein
MPKLFVHVGAPKCASTSIQSFIFSNAKRLNEHGLMVSDDHLNFGAKCGSPLWFVQNLIDRGLDGERVTQAVETLGDRNGVITAENLSNPAAAALFKAIAGRFDIHVLHVIRRQDDWLYSAWKQWSSKEGIGLKEYIDTALQRGEPGFAKTIDAWSAVAKTVKTISLDATPSLEVEILNWLGLANDGCYAGLQKEMNPTFDFRIVDLLSRHRGVHEGEHDRKIELFISSYSRLALSEKFRLPAVLWGKIMAHFYDENVSLLGPEIANGLAVDTRAERKIAGGFSQTEEHDFVIACLLEGMGRMSEELAQLRTDLNSMRTLGKAAAPAAASDLNNRHRWWLARAVRQAKARLFKCGDPRLLIL